MSIWNHKESWTHRNKNFSVIISRHKEKVHDDDPTGPYRWCVYAYVYPEHPRFDELAKTKSMSDCPKDIPLHGGCSFYRQHRIDDELTSIEIGCDYNHLHDCHFSHMLTLEEASEVLFDAEQLIKHLAQ